MVDLGQKGKSRFMLNQVNNRSIWGLQYGTYFYYICLNTLSIDEMRIFLTFNT